MQYWRRLMIVIVGFIEALLWSGCLFGWPTLLHVLQREGVYSHLCPSLNYTLPEIPSTTTAAFHLPVLPEKDQDLPKASQTTLAKAMPDIDDFFDDDEIFQRQRRSAENEIHPMPVLHKTHCKEQTVQMTLVYTVAAVAYGFTSILIGFSLDMFGLWFTRLGGCVMTSGGFFFLTFTSKETPWMLWPAMILIALGTSQLRLSSFQFANLWPQYRTTVLLLYSSAYSVSTTLFLLIQIAYVASVPYKTIVFLIAGVSLLTFPPTFMMPRMRIEDHNDIEPTIPEDKPQKDRKLSSSSVGNDVTLFGSGISKSDDNVPRILKNKGEEKSLMNPFDEPEDENEAERKPLTKEVPLGSSLCTLSAGLHIFWHFITFFLVLFYSSTFMPWIQMTTDDSKTIEHYNKISGVCALIAPIFIPIAGLITDWQIRKASKHENKEEKLALTMQAPATTKAIASLFVLGTMICKVFFTPAAIYMSMVLIAISRPFIVGSCASYIRIRFHPSHFNRLNGIFTTLVSMLCLLQFPIIVWMEKSKEDFVRAQLLLIAILIISLTSPGHMMITPLARKYARFQLRFRTDI